MVQNLNALTEEIDPKELKYIPDRRLRTAAAADRAVEIVSDLTRSDGSRPEADEKSRFVALLFGIL